MYYFIDTFSEKMNVIVDIPEEDCRAALEANDRISTLVDFFFLGNCVCNSLTELAQWSYGAQLGGNWLIRNLHIAEKMCRNFMFEFRTALDHMETQINREYGKKSMLYQVFKEATAQAYDSCPEYAFTYHLRNCSQHCKDIVHGFRGTKYLGISSSCERLMHDYSEWKSCDKAFMNICGENIDLLSTFECAFGALNTVYQSVFEYMLNEFHLGDDVLMLREFGHFFLDRYGHGIHSFHIASFQKSDGSNASVNDIHSAELQINICAIDWDSIFCLSDLISHKE